MPALRPTPIVRAANTTSRALTAQAPLTKGGYGAQAKGGYGRVRQFTESKMLKSGDAHGDHYDPPSGWLWGIKPGEKREKEGWENIFFYGYFGSLLFGVVGYAFKPDTSIQTWALEEARRRLEVEGILEEPQDK